MCFNVLYTKIEWMEEREERKETATKKKDCKKEERQKRKEAATKKREWMEERKARMEEKRGKGKKGERR